MSAMCCTRGSTLVTSDRVRSRLPTITVRLSPEEKQLFAELAASRGLSECALAVATLRASLIPGTSFVTNIPNASPREAATDRITIRLRPGDGVALEARAARRRMKTSTYLAALVRWCAPTSPPIRFSRPTSSIPLRKPSSYLQG